MSLFKKRTPPASSNILLYSTTSFSGNRVGIGEVWQPPRASLNLGETIARSITSHEEEQLDAVLSQYVQTHGLSNFNFTPLHTYTFNRKDEVSGNSWHHGSEYRIALKGTPEKILQLCDLSDGERESLMHTHHRLASTGLSVIALAAANTNTPIKNLRQLPERAIFSFSGYISLRIEPSNQFTQLVTKAVKQNKTVRLITGLHPESAFAFAKQLQLVMNPSEVLDLRHLDVLTSEDAKTKILAARVYTRATDKDRKIINDTFKKTNQTTAEIDSLEVLKSVLSSSSTL